MRVGISGVGQVLYYTHTEREAVFLKSEQLRLQRMAHCVCALI